jgi:hypothetical protein
MEVGVGVEAGVDVGEGVEVAVGRLSLSPVAEIGLSVGVAVGEGVSVGVRLGGAEVMRWDDGEGVSGASAGRVLAAIVVGLVVGGNKTSRPRRTTAATINSDPPIRTASNKWFSLSRFDIPSLLA